jgi:arylsulfatase A-like enzyme
MLASCRSPEAEPQPWSPRLVLLYATCTVNKGFLSPYNDEVVYTPGLDKLAEKSVTFLRHYTEAGSSGIAYASILTGTQANRHGVFQMPKKLGDEVLLLPEVYASHGYDTFFWDGHGMASGSLNYGQGVSQEHIYGGRLAAWDQRFRSVLERLQSDPDYKVFIMAFSSVTHAAYSTKNLESFRKQHPALAEGLDTAEIESFARTHSKSHLALSFNTTETLRRLAIHGERLAKFVAFIELLYASNINVLDQLFSGILAAVGTSQLTDDSLIVFTADHGEALYRDNLPFKWAHSLALAPEVLSVPLIVFSGNPDFRPGTYDGVTRSIDLFPTMLGLSGIALSNDGAHDGFDLSPVLAGRAPKPDLLAYSHTTIVPAAIHEKMYSNYEGMWTHLRRFYPRIDPDLMWVAVTEGDRMYKYRNMDGERWGFEMFDLSNDPTEAANLFDPKEPKHDLMAKRLKRYKADLVAAHQRFAEGTAARTLLKEEEAEALRRLGYIE